MDENAKKIQREIAKDKVQVILASIALSVLVVMEFYVMINYKSNFIAMAAGILLMIFALFFLISALMDMSLKQKDMEQEKYEEIYNAQKASYLVIKKSFDEMEQRLRAIEENSSLPAEDIINAQKAVAKVTISRSKENTDALMNSNDELINQLFNIQEKLDSNNSQIIEKQQSLLKESNLDLQQKIAALTTQISSIEGKIQNGIPVMASQPMQMQVPPVTPQPTMPMPEAVLEPTPEIIPEPTIEEVIQEEISEPVPEMEPEPEFEAAVEEAPVEDLGLDLDIAIEEPAAEDEVGLDLDSMIEESDSGDASLEEPIAEEISLEESVAEEAVQEPVEEIAVEDIQIEAVEEIPVEETQVEEAPIEEATIEESPVEEVPAEPVIEEPVVEEAPSEPVAEEPVVEETVEVAPEASEPALADPGASLDTLLDEIGETVEEPEPEPEPVPEQPEEEKDDSIVIPDVGVDLTDPNRVMSPEEIEKLFANI
ncbi:hypothetical protein [Pseudobutyrivibrio sp. MD2005]|uniref:hypothetical protein n=1 Tax=Pseudobutyrivibrio sp. MD2005 TaxID=1410616 RepID=UPI0004820923|nr:hypothetical protein [Pseudobutyrivibrio sp. MD2005]